MILAGDIGGTKTNLAFFEKTQSGLEVHFIKEYPSKNYRSFSTLLEEFLKECGSVMIEGACFGVAGAVLDGVCETTNLPWRLVTSELETQTQTPNIWLINDLEAAAYGMLYLEEAAFVDLTPNNKSLSATRAVIAAGTGLGEAILYYDGVHFHPMATEGGHCDFAAQNALEDALLLWLRKRHGEHVSYERVVCGDGISALYDFLHEQGYASEPRELQNIEENADKNALITECALSGDRLSQEVMRLFVSIYAAEAGNLALKSLARGGVYIGGGIAPKILPFLQDGVFVEAFCAKGRFRPLLEQISIKISTDPLTPLRGAAHFCKDRVK